ncbi:hypothetical protein Tsubulata_012604 [Turnera subulata]|uniref:Embryo sac development arrest 6 n=1 Tax=Turnera subulata TaxID=218843 RepID=A0A9Q0JAI3_9ROSI|nr:hypothetical protein Tsubulata_012604 [Turnera subulata]
MSYHPHRILPPGASRKRKETESFYSTKPSSAPTTAHYYYPPAPRAENKSAASAPSNRLLAGYMAYEFLTRGTLFGERFDPARVKAVPVSELKRGKLVGEEAELGGGGGGGGGGSSSSSCNKAVKGYAEVAGILKADGVHIPGIVNPTELARWLQR